MLTYWMNPSGSFHQCNAPEVLRLPGEPDATFVARVVLPVVPAGSRQVTDSNSVWGTVMTGLLTIDKSGNLVVDAGKQQFLASAVITPAPAAVTLT